MQPEQSNSLPDNLNTIVKKTSSRLRIDEVGDIKDINELKDINETKEAKETKETKEINGSKETKEFNSNELNYSIYNDDRYY